MRALLLIVLFSTCNVSFAQTVGKSTPASNNYKLSSEIPVVEIINQIQIAPYIDDKSPVQAGYTLPFNTKLLNNGIWENTGSIYIWRLEIQVANANALNLYFQNIKLKGEEKIFLYNPGKSDIIEIGFGKNTCTDFITGDRLIIEFNSKERNKIMPFSIDEVGVRFTSGLELSRGFGSAGICEVRVNCTEGEHWQNEKKGVARILVKQNNLTFWCTGSLINNTSNDGTPYFLTANHCGELSDSIDYSKWLFYFNFESADCDQPVIEPGHNTVSGSTLLANSPSGTNNGSDFKLLLLNEDIEASYKPYFNGWNITGKASPSGVSIHHPQGDVKMISTYTGPLVSTKFDNNNEDPNGMYWQVHWDKTQNGHGVTEGGSSGSPVFDNNGYIVGTLTGGAASCNRLTAPDYYGKFSYSWESNRGGSTTNLRKWLDPIQSGVSKLSGTNLNSANIYAGFSGEPKSIIVGGSVTFINTSFGNISGYQWHFEGGTPEYSELKEPGAIQYLSAGEFDVQLVVSSSDGSNKLYSKDYIKVLPNISPNPTDGKFKLAFGGEIPVDYSIRVFDVLGKETGYIIEDTGDDYITINVSQGSKGTYFVKFTSPLINNTFKLIIIGN